MAGNAITICSTPIDLLKESAAHLIAVSFPKSRAASYQAAVNIAKQALLYSEMEVGGEVFHHVVFGRDKDDAARARALVNYTTSLKGVQIYAGGKVIQNPVRVSSVLACYLEAAACNDWRAHCFKVIDSPYKETETLPDGPLVFDVKELFAKKPAPKVKYIYPCAFIYRFDRLPVVSTHPSSPEDQIQARAIEHGCDWCPKFDQNNFKKLS